MEILNKLFNPKPKLDRIYLSCLDEKIVTKYPSWIIYLSETQANIEKSYPITAYQLINKDRLKSLHWEYDIRNNIVSYSSNSLIKLKYIVKEPGVIVDLSDITMNFLNLVKLEIRGYRIKIQNVNSLGQLEHLKIVSFASAICYIGSFIELLERKDYLKTLSIYNFSLSEPVSFSKQYLIQFLNGNKTLTNLKIVPCQTIVDDSLIYQPITNTTLKNFEYGHPNDVIGSMLLNEWIGSSAFENIGYSLTNNIPLISKGNHPNINFYYYDGSKDNLNNLINILKSTYKGIKNVFIHIEDNDIVEEVIETLKEYLPSNHEINTINLENGLEIAKYLIQLNHPSIKELTLDLFNPIDQDIAINLLKSFCTKNYHIQNISIRFELNSLNLAEFIDSITEIIENNHNIYGFEFFLHIPDDSITDTTNLNHSFERFEKTISKFYHYLDFIIILIYRGVLHEQKDIDLLNPFENILSKYSILYNIKLQYL
ncbi:hypothetical protein DLAC_08468 [Tieghemostelium lacteum]|uniref:Uncharacterized protein n=1 Tax=Tieghemostelium lacteum TaxID=361077 RepID=A0A151Z7G4_TIELA|nr:hypothetical protein DLAC_08468 [Tieghemostelium lacteum]|eukprot:KYQ89903.1 hypothetical protein DLAC_08468 [Tieghemostelium lacteum]